MDSLALRIAPELSDRVRLGLLALEGVSVRERDPGLDGAISGYGDELRRRYPEAKSADIPGAADARALYKAVGLDPTKTRPSNEALLRRVLKGEALYTVNTLVDALNLCSLRAQLPFGLYDLDRLEPPVVLRKGLAGESYEGVQPSVNTANTLDLKFGNHTVYVNAQGINYEYPVIFDKSKLAYAGGIYALADNGSLLWYKPARAQELYGQRCRACHCHFRQRFAQHAGELEPVAGKAGGKHHPVRVRMSIDEEMLVGGHRVEADRAAVERAGDRRHALRQEFFHPRQVALVELPRIG